MEEGGNRKLIAKSPATLLGALDAFSTSNCTPSPAVTETVTEEGC